MASSQNSGQPGRQRAQSDEPQIIIQGNRVEQTDLEATNSYLSDTIHEGETVLQLMNKSAFNDFKDLLKLKQKCTTLIDCLRQFGSQSNSAFFKCLTDALECFKQIKYQLQRYLDANMLRRSYIASDVRAQLRQCSNKLTFVELLLESMYNNNSNANLISNAVLNHLQS